jgi:matrix metalloproteinase-14 (membrane-inserted)
MLKLMASSGDNAEANGRSKLPLRLLLGLLIVIVSTEFIVLVDSAPTVNAEIHKKAKSYLRTFGHINKDSDDSITDDDLTSGLRSIQKMAGLPETGQLDDATQALMKTPRCGLPDKHPGIANRTRRYATVSKWPTNYLKYYVSNGPASSLTAAQVSGIIRRAFQFWTDVACLNISAAPTMTAAQLQLSFQRYNHGDGNSFDGPGKILGHSFYPTYGIIHFDNSETWTDSTFAGTNLLQVAVHEIGHSLGLAHSSIKSAVMYPYYGGYQPSFSLNPDDIAGIKRLYSYCPTTTKASTTVKASTAKTTTAKRTTSKPVTTAPRCPA